MLDASDDKDQLDQIISALPKYTKEEALELNKAGTLLDGTIFQIDDSGIERDNEAKGEHWMAGVFVQGIMPLVDYDLGLFSDSRMKVLKRKGVVKLMEIAETKWIPTSKYPWVPQRYVNIESGKKLYTKESIKNELEEATNEHEVIDPNFHATVE